MTLRLCKPHWRPGELRQEAPVIETYTDTLYWPIDPALSVDEDRRWGLYGRDGALIGAGAYYRGPGQTLVGQGMYQAWPEAVATADGPMLYGGVIIEHFGHFLLSSTARLWPLLQPGFDRASVRVLFHGVADAAQWWRMPYMAACFTALGLTPSNVVRLSVPTRVRHLLVPRPAFEEHNFVHAAYVDLARAVGAVLPRPPNPQRGPVYLARTRYPRITQGFVNEQALVDRLAALGVAIAYPETMDLGAHVDLFRTASIVLGPVSSTFHPAIFASKSCPLLMLSPTRIVNPNFDLLDRAGALPSEYAYVDPQRLPFEAGGRIGQRTAIRDLDALTRDIVSRLRAVHA